MAIDTMENVVTLLAVILGLLYALFNYIRTPKRGWLYLSVFFLTHMLSDYYWTTYTLIMGDNPDVSAMMAYFGWNVGYLFLFLFCMDMRPKYSKGYFHPLMLIPIPLGVIQFFLYIQYGGIFNNLWEGTLVTLIMVFSLQVLARYFCAKNPDTPFPAVHMALLLVSVFEYGMWTSSCFDWPSVALNPYYYFSLAEAFTLILFGPAAKKSYSDVSLPQSDSSPQETRFTVLLQATVSIIIFFGCVGGYYLGFRMKQAIPSDEAAGPTYEKIAISLFVISVFLVAFILMIILMTAIRYRSIDSDIPVDAAIRRSRFNFIFTIIITFCLMSTSVLYTSRLFYNVSVKGALEDGQTMVYSTSVELENYLTVATSTLLVVADSIEVMLKNGRSQDDIRNYIIDQTNYQKDQFRDDLTGFYSYINGEYMDGIGWVPPSGYDATKRDWYKYAVAANGDITIVPPYVDAQSHEIVITICKLLKDGKKDGDYYDRKVVALDLIVNHIQDVTADVSIGGKGYALVVDSDGLIIAHHDPELNGKTTGELYGKDFMSAVVSSAGSSTEAVMDGQKCTLFVEPVMEHWYIIIAISNNKLLEDTYNQLAVNIIVSLVIFLLISFFYYLGYKNEQLNAKKMEDMRAEGLKQSFEAESLKQKEAAAYEANKAKSRFLAQMSHEIRTPINAVLGMNEMILRVSDDKEILGYAENIDSAGNTLLALINSILDFSKIEDGKMDIIPVEFDTMAFIGNLVNSISLRADAKGLALKLEIDSELPKRLYGDDVRLTQVIMNLLTNAVKYTEKGSVTLTMKKDISDNDKIRIYVSISDTGIGIRSEDISKLCLTFERLDEIKNRNIEGTGLGMSIVTSLLGLMDSHINVESTYGQGSVFYFNIVLGIVDPAPIGDFDILAGKSKTLRSENDLISAPHARVLVVDDNSLNLTVAINLLSLCHIHADEATSGAGAIEKMSDNTYDIVFLDHMMPEMDGIETFKELKRRSLIPSDTSMVALTANAVIGSKEIYLNEGFDAYLSKPIVIKDLVDILKKYLPESAYASTQDNTDESIMEFAPKDPSSKEPVSADGSGYDTSLLASAGIDIGTGLMYCGSDEDIFFETLDDLIEEFDSRQNALNEDFEKKDWMEYSILIHALKSNLKSVGAIALADEAFALETASRNNDENYVAQNHQKVMDEYKKTIDILLQAKK